MISVITDKECKYPFNEILEPFADEVKVKVEPYRQRRDEEILVEAPHVIVVAHTLAILHVRALRALIGSISMSAPPRLIAVLPEQAASHALNAMVAGADKCFVAPFEQSALQESLWNSLNEYNRVVAALELVRNQTVIHARYTPVSVAGVGRHSVVLIAEDIVVQKHMVTIKILDNLSDSDYVQLEEFTSKADTLSDPAAVLAPEMAPIIGIGTYEHCSYVVFDLPNAVNLYEHMREKTFTEAELIGFALTCSRALNKLLAVGQLHLDLTPSNIFYVNGEYVISDFGTCTKSAKADETGSSHWCGVGFAAPEFFQSGGRLSARSDVFSLGMLLYCMVVRENPILGRPMPDACLHALEEPLKIRDTKIKLSGSVKAAIESMILKEEDHRPQPRDLELIFEQLLTSRISHSSVDLELPVLNHDGEKQLVDTSHTQTALRIQRMKETRTRQNKIRDKNKKREYTLLEFFLDYMKDHFVVIAVSLVLSLLIFFSGFILGKKQIVPTYFNQGPRTVFSCYNGHIKVRRTLDFRSILCSDCMEECTPAMTCKDCDKNFASSIWPKRDMTDKECQKFEENNLAQCPFCRSFNIAPMPLPAGEK